MKAVLCKVLGTPDELELDEIERPEPDENQVLIRVQACSINFPDLLMVAGKYQESPRHPFIPGGQVAGVVETVGSGVTDIGPGQAVMAVTFKGGLAEFVAADRAQVFDIPHGMPTTVVRRAQRLETK